MYKPDFFLSGFLDLLSIYFTFPQFKYMYMIFIYSIHSLTNVKKKPDKGRKDVNSHKTLSLAIRFLINHFTPKV